MLKNEHSRRLYFNFDLFHFGLLRRTSLSTQLHISFNTPSTNPVEEFLPTCKSLTGPYPETRRNSNNERHKVLYHEDLKIWFPSEVPASFPDRAGY